MVSFIYTYDGEKIIRIARFPQTQDFISKEGQHVDAGYRYKQFSICGIPLWNYDGKWCGYLDSDHYVDLSKADLDEGAQQSGLKLPDKPSLPFWHSYGGKLVIAAILCFFGLRKSDDK